MGRKVLSTGGYLTYTASSAPSASALSIAQWFLLTNTSAAGFTLCGFGSTVNSANYFGAGIAISGGSSKCNAFSDAGSGESDAIGPTISLNTWHLIVATFNGTTTTCYTDGGNVATAGENNPSAGNVKVVTLGALQDGGAGVLSRPTVPVILGPTAIFTTVLTALEISDMYYSRRPLNTYRPNALWSYWSLVARNGSIEPDNSGFGRHLSLVSNPPPALDPPINYPRRASQFSSWTSLAPSVQLLRPVISNPWPKYDRWDYYP
jgi:hypothetical protein